MATPLRFIRTRSTAGDPIRLRFGEELAVTAPAVELFESDICYGVEATYTIQSGSAVGIALPLNATLAEGTNWQELRHETAKPLAEIEDALAHRPAPTPAAAALLKLWSEGDRLAHDPALRHELAAMLEGEIAIGHNEASSASNGVAIAINAIMGRLSVSGLMVWRAAYKTAKGEAAIRTRADRTERAIGLELSHTGAAWPLAGWWWGVTPEPPPPVVDPAITLLFHERIRASSPVALRFGFIRPAATVTIPTRGVYFVLNSVAVYLADTLEDLPVSAIEIGMDADGHSWRFSATALGERARIAVEADGGRPKELVVHINGYNWAVIAESWAEDLSFGKRGLKISGRGLTAELLPPYELPVTRTNQAGTVAQVLAEHLPLGSGWTLNWGVGAVEAWPVPAGAWSVSNQSPLSAIQAGATGVGLRLAPHRMDRVIDIVERYPVAPWHYWDAVPDLTIPRAAVISYTREQAIASQANGITVTGGEVGGVLAVARIAGTDGARRDSPISHPLITSASAARIAAGRALAGKNNIGTWRQLTVPLGGDFPLAQVGELVQVGDGTAVERHTVAGVSISVNRTGGVTVRQQITLDEHTDNQFSAFTRLLTNQPETIGTVATIEADGTATVNTISGGTVRVRTGSGSVQIGGRVFVYNGAITGTAPAFPTYEIEL